MRTARLLLGAALLAARTAQAAPCVGGPDAPAFGVQALKSEMMLVAVGCRAQAGYNAVIRKFRGDILAHERTVGRWFAEAYGAQGQARHDSYISDLANEQSLAAIRGPGAGFCAAQAGLFREILALRRGADLPALAQRLAFVRPGAPALCPAAEAPTAAAATTMHRPLRAAD